MSHYPPPATPAEWVAAIEHGYATYDMAPGHHVVVSTPDLIQARCSCGWEGPDRTFEAIQLGDDGLHRAVVCVIVDVDMHVERVAADARAVAAALAMEPKRLWWER